MNLFKDRPDLLNQSLEFLQDPLNVHYKYFLMASAGLLGVQLVRRLFFSKKSYEFKGKWAVVTGASSGIGLEIATLLAKRGSKVIFIARSEDKLAEVTKELNLAGHEAHYIAADLSKEADITRVIKIIGDLTGGTGYVDILVNNAGAGQWKFLEDTSFDECYQMMCLPYFAAFHMTRLLLPAMHKKQSGLIVIVNSPVSFQVWPGCIGYACSRYALKGFSECLRMECHGTGIRVLDVVPGEVKSNYFTQNGIDNSNFPNLSIILPQLTPLSIAQTTVDGIASHKKSILVPFRLKCLLFLNGIVPDFLKNILFNSPKNVKRLERLNKESSRD